MQLVVNERHEPVERRLLPTAPGMKQLGDLLRGLHGQRSPSAWKILISFAPALYTSFRRLSTGTAGNKFEVHVLAGFPHCLRPSQPEPGTGSLIKPSLLFLWCGTAAFRRPTAVCPSENEVQFGGHGRRGQDARESVFVDAIIGLHLLRRYKGIIIDFKTRKIVFGQAKPLASVTRWERDSSLMIIEAWIHGRPVPVEESACAAV